MYHILVLYNLKVVKIVVFEHWFNAETLTFQGAETSSGSRKVSNLKAILRACNLMPIGKQHTVVFGECRNDNDYARKLKSLLKDAGMSGEYQGIILCQETMVCAAEFINWVFLFLFF